MFLPPSRRALLAALGAAALTGCRGRAEAADPPHGVLRPAPRPAGFHAGMSLAHIHARGRGYGSEVSRQQMRHLRQLGVTHVSLTPFGYIGAVDDPDIRFGESLDRTLTDDDLRQEARNARAEGLAVCIKPHIWSWRFMSGQSRQDIAPPDWAAWFERYTAFAMHYAALAQEVDAALFVLGLEYLKATQANPGAWATVAEACRRKYTGPITYAANWWTEVEAFQDWGAFDLIGVQAYHPLTQQLCPDVQALVQGWAAHLEKLSHLSQEYARPVLFTEAGLRAVEGAAVEPWNAGLRGSPDPGLQARAYEALLAACTPKPWFAGVYWWKWFTDPTAEDDLYAPTGNPAEEILRAWWGGASLE
ncbi:MAG: hypothetical protein H6739_33830 [Alphaproteobacteria bacterium]|nr:hypothetical protein [Alphaproteobacteria bacterium]